MKRIFIAAIALLATVAVSTHLYGVNPERFLGFWEERSMLQRLAEKHQSLAQLDIKPTYASPRMVKGVEMIDAFIAFDNQAALDKVSSLGVIIHSVFDDFATALIPVAALEKVSRVPGITDVEISRVVELCTDSTLKVTNAGQVIHGTQNGLRHDYDGTGVIIGMIDSGFDYKHLAFRDGNDTSRSRIVRVYDLLDSTAHPARNGTYQMPGGVFMGEQLDTLINDGTSTHGTHTTSIAAGLHVNGYGGMAPGADIVLCVCRDMDMIIHETDVANCIKYIKNYADTVGKPCVMNLSISTVNGSHDGNDWISRAASQMTGPGRIVVVSTGNTSNKNTYSCGPATVNKPFRALLGYDNSGIDDDDDLSYYYKSTTNDIWVRASNVRPVISFHVFDKTTKRVVWESEKISLHSRINWSEISDYFEPDLTVDQSAYLFAYITLAFLPNKYEATCNVYNMKSKEYTVQSDGKITSRYQIGISVYPPVLAYPNQPDSCYVDMWTSVGASVIPPQYVYVEDVNDAGDTYLKPVQGYYAVPSDDCSIGTYAVHDSIISAGAYSAKNAFVSMSGKEMNYPWVTIGDIASFSSYQAEGCGPTGKALPTVCAPGTYVVAAGSRYSFFGKYNNPSTVMRTSDGSYWGALAGTSMAAPTVAGIIAQWLQVNPQLSPSDVKNIIAQTAIKDEFTMTGSNRTHFGPNGKIDAMAGIRYLLAQMPVEVIMGDLNGDGRIDVDDVVMLISDVLGMEVPGIILEARDLNDDGHVDVDDVVAIIDIVLHSS